MKNLKKILLIGTIIATFHNSFAGYIIAGDSRDNGYIKTSLTFDDTILIEKCPATIGQCSETILEVRKNEYNIGLVMGKAKGYAKIAAASGAYVFTTFLAICGGLELGAFIGGTAAFTSPGFIAGAIGSAAVGTNEFSKLRSLNVLRLYDYSQIFDLDFIKSTKDTIILPDDGINEIADYVIDTIDR